MGTAHKSPPGPVRPYDFVMDARLNALAPGKTIQVFHDGDCPLCNVEIDMLKRLDWRDRIVFTDIAAPGFDPDDVGLSMDALMDRIHGRIPDGSTIEGVEVFRRLYAAIGLGPLVTLTRLPGISHLLDWGYRVFAKNRLKWTGRCSDDVCLPSNPWQTAAPAAGSSELDSSQQVA